MYVLISREMFLKTILELPFTAIEKGSSGKSLIFGSLKLTNLQSEEKGIVVLQETVTRRSKNIKCCSF